MHHIHHLDPPNLGCFLNWRERMQLPYPVSVCCGVKAGGVPLSLSLWVLSCHSKPSNSEFIHMNRRDVNAFGLSKTLSMKWPTNICSLV